MTPFKKLYKKIENYDVITLFSHVYPDGDAVGSLIGLKEAIKTTFPNKKVYAISTGVEDFKEITGEFDEVKEEIIANSFAIILDVANSERVEDQRFKLAKETFLIDHHIFVHTYTNEAIIDTEKIATSEIIADFIFENKMKISPLGASSLLLGIITDSGRVMYEKTSTLTFNLAAKLLQKGAELSKINNILMRKTLDQLRFRGYILSNFKARDGVTYIVITKEILEEHNLDFESAGTFVNQIGNIDGYPIWASFVEISEKEILVELRSNKYNVQEVAVLFGGGGHRLAAGCKIDSFSKVEAVVNELIKKIK